MDSDWARLQKHLLDLILEKVEYSVDYLRFGAVCLQWHSIMKDNQDERIKTLHHQYQYYQVPMLLLPSHDEHVWNIYNIMFNKFLESELLVPYGKRFCGSSKGWLFAVNEDWTITLYKPYSMVKDGKNANTSIQLPCLFPPTMPEDEEDFVRHAVMDFKTVCDYHVYKALITADPLANPDECIVIVIFDDIKLLAFIRPAQDSTWTRIQPAKYFNSEEVLHYNNLFYVVTVRGALISFDVKNSCVNSTIKYLAPEIPFGYNSMRYSFIKRYLVESNGEILQVERYLYCNKAENIVRLTKFFRVCLFDFKLGKWKRKRSLDGMALFLGDNSSVSVLASKFVGIQSNCIYFTHDVDMLHFWNKPMICDLGIFDVESRKFKLHFTIDPVALSKMNNRPPIWVVPTF